MQSEMSPKELLDMLVKSFASDYTLPEIKKIQGFYDLPIGCKLGNTKPLLANE